MIHLDTHAVVWLYEGRVEAFPAALLARIGRMRPLVSPAVRLELAFLHEIGRLTAPPSTVLDALAAEIDLGVAEASFERVVGIATRLLWTRDPFDRLIAAHAMADDLPLVTRDRTIRAHCPVSWWD